MLWSFSRSKAKEGKMEEMSELVGSNQSWGFKGHKTEALEGAWDWPHRPCVHYGVSQIQKLLPLYAWCRKSQSCHHSLTIKATDLSLPRTTDDQAIMWNSTPQLTDLWFSIPSRKYRGRRWGLKTIENFVKLLWSAA